MKPRFHTLDEKLGPLMALMCGFQHVLAMFVGIVTPPLIIGSALGFDPADAGFLVGMSLFVSGICTFIQVWRFGRLGSGLLSVQGTSFTFVPLALEAGRSGGYPLILGLAMCASPVEMILSRFIPLLRRLFPPVVTGSVVMLIGISLIRVGMTDIAGGHGAEDFGHPRNLAMGFFVIAVIVTANRVGGGYLRIISVALGLIAGYAVAVILGWVDFAPVQAAGLIVVPAPLKFGIELRPQNIVPFLVPWVIGYVITTIETIGDLTATSAVSREPVKGSIYLRRLEGGILADGIGSFIASIFSTLPNTTFSQNNGVISLSGVASRRAGLAVAGILVVFGLFPKLAAFIAVMPKPVLGGATSILFATVAVAGFRLVAMGGLTRRREFILAVTLALSLGSVMVPESFDGISRLDGPGGVGGWMLASVETVMKSGIAVAGITSTCLNLLLPHEEDRASPGPPAE